MAFERWLYVMRLRIRSLLHRDRIDEELSEELRYHIDCKTQELRDRGLTARDARDAALRAFGGLDQRREECRDAQGVRVFEEVRADVRYGARALVRSPAFSIVAVLSLALGIGANTAIFTLVDTLLLKELPVQRPDELRVMNLVIRGEGRDLKSNTTVPYRWFKPVRETSGVFSDALAFAPLADAEIRAGARVVSPSATAIFVSENYFAMLGVGPQRGRVFEEPSPHDTAVVLGDTFWRRQFDADSSILGQSIIVNDAAFTVIGIAPAGFAGLSIGRAPDLYLPLNAFSVAQPGVMTLADRENWVVHLIGRLRSGVSEAVAAERLTTFRSSLDSPRVGRPEPIVRLLSLDRGLSNVRERLLQPLSVLMVMVGLLLFISCANVAAMLLSRASSRRGEIVIRATMGASYGRLVRQLLTEALLLAIAAAALGTLVSAWALAAVSSILPPGPAAGLELALDRRALLFTVGVSILASVISGLAPALHALRGDVGSALRDRRSSGTASGGRLGRWFVTAQIALALTLMVGAGLLARTLHGLTTLSPGFDVDGLIVADVNPGAREYKGARLAAYYREVLDRLHDTPGTRHATLLQFSFLTNAQTTGTLAVPGFTPATDTDRWVNVYQVGPQFFTTLGMKIVQGRDFEDRDFVGAAGVAALSDAAARRFFGDANPIGRTVGDDGSPHALRIIAVVRDARTTTLRQEPVATLFVPYTGAGRTRMTFAIRAEQEESSLAAVTGAIRSIDPHVPLRVRSVGALAHANVGQERLLAIIAGFFAGAALFLLSLGLYGVMAFWVAERTSEIGVRLALGARRAQVMWAVLQHPLRFVGVGGVVGLLITAAGSRLIVNLLFGLTWQDPLTVSAALAVLLVVCLLAAVVPALRASRVDPVVALRSE